MAKPNMRPPKPVADNAAKGLRLRERHGHGGTEVGVKRAEGLKARQAVSEDDIVRIISYFARHEVDRKAPNFGDDDAPSPGYVAWLLWGGDEGRVWAVCLKNELDSFDG
jgi:hypothetical protein